MRLIFTQESIREIQKRSLERNAIHTALKLSTSLKSGDVSIEIEQSLAQEVKRITSMISLYRPKKSRERRKVE